MTIGGVKLDLAKVKLPIYELCAKEDHIAPAKSVFIGSRLFGGPVTYVLAGSGPHRRRHQSPARRPKYQFLDQRQEGGDAGGLARGAQEHRGSWWPHYAEWLAKHSRRARCRRARPGASLGVIEDAPGSYVKVKS
jgi:polyhydroxyalkanoate synthase